MSIDANGIAVFKSMVAQVQEGGKLVRVWP